MSWPLAKKGKGTSGNVASGVQNRHFKTKIVQKTVSTDLGHGSMKCQSDFIAIMPRVVSFHWNVVVCCLVCCLMVWCFGPVLLLRNPSDGNASKN